MTWVYIQCVITITKLIKFHSEHALFYALTNHFKWGKGPNFLHNYSITTQL